MSIHPLGGAHAPRTEPMRVLEEIKRLALETLGGLPGGLYEPVEDALKRSVQGDDGHDAPQLLYQNQAALWVLRQHHATHVMRYRQQVARGFDDFRVLRIRNRGDLPLGLIDESQIDFHLAGQGLAEAIEHSHSRALETMAGRLQAVAAVLGLPPTVNPIGPTRLATAFVETFNDEQVPAPLRVLLFAQYQRALDAELGELYAKVNELLANSGYGAAERAPTGAMPIRPPAPRADFDGVGQADSAGSRYEREERREQGTYAPPASGAPGAAPTSAELSELRSMLHAWRDGRLNNDAADAGAGQPPTPSRRQLRVEEVVSVASLLQGEPSDVFARALADSGRLASAIRDQLNDGSRRLGLNPEQISFSVEEEDAIDLVALLFDSVFSSHHLQDRARRLYARLVLPFIKVALTDQAMFVQSAHPARRLLDAITEACAGNRAETPQERELLDRAAAASQRVVAEYNEDLAIFETAHAELDALLQQQRRRIELQAERAAKATFGRERLNHAREQADAVLTRRIAAPPLSRAVSDFLGTSWRHHLVQTLLREGEDSESFAAAVALGDALVEADRIAADGRGRDLAQRLLALEPTIVACLGSSGLDPSSADHALAVLVKGLVYPNAPRDLHDPPAAHVDDDAAERERWLVGGMDPLRFDPSVFERMRALQPGEWLQLTDIQGETVDAKIAWISPLSARRLLVNRRGLRVLVASAEELASLATAGRLQVGCEPTAFEQAMRHMREELDRGVTRH
ncbi:DUF1631 family protein [Novilysobacter erysipheiresistens]|uniref:DUF1631 family protein n=1 Tax=Novilysobacter erysipheiresistens TaxID=1749332 RepID=A0ABU7Z1U2_9GAMM